MTIRERIRASFGRSPAIVAILTAVTVLGALAVAVIVAAVKVDAGLRAYISAESLWSKAQQQAVYHLDRFAERGNTADLVKAKRALAVPTAYRHAHEALEESPPETERAERLLKQSGVNPKDIPDMVWIYGYHTELPYFRDAITAWRLADAHIVELNRIASELALSVGATGPSRQRINEIRKHLAKVDNSVRAWEHSFSNSLSSGSRVLRVIMLVSGVLLVLTLGVGGTWMAVLAIRRIARSDSKTRATFEQAAVGMTQIDLNGYVIDANGALCEILERARSELVGERFDGFRHPDGEDTMERCRHDLIEGDAQRCVLEQRYLRPDGKAVQCKVTASLVHDGNQRPSYFIAVVEDVSEAHRLAAELAHQAAHDSLTGLLNRASFEQRLDEAVRSAHERQRRHVLGFIDLDQFKVVNDTCGHIAGDELLQQASALMRAELAQSDVLARLGGDEFGVIFRGEEMDAAAAAAERLRAAVAEYVFVWGERSFNITISMGLVAVNEHSPDTGGLLQAADTACYLAKDRGRNRIQRYAESAEEIALRRGEMEWIGRLREAMKEDRLRLDAQPIQPLGDHGGLRCELLVRLIDTEGEVHYPGAFLGAAERYNAASALDRWVLATTCRHLAEDQDLLTRFESIHVNLSAQSLDGTAFLEFVEETLDRYGTPGEALCFEITETAAISNLPEARRFIERLAARGCSFALDDFGSGLSSFGYLKALPIDIIKIDGAFVRHIDSDPADMAVVRSIHEIARAVGIRTVAEFVETAEAQRILTEIGVDFGQGFHIARPAALSETLALAAGS